MPVHKLKKVVKPKEETKSQEKRKAISVKKSPIALYLELEDQMKVAFKELCQKKLTINDLLLLADKSRVQKEFACSKLIQSSDIDILLVVVKRSFQYRDGAALKILDKVDNASDDNLRVLIQKNVCVEAASYELEERRKLKNRKKANE